MSEPQPIREIMPFILADIKDRMDATRRRQRAQEQAVRQRRIVAAIGGFQQGQIRARTAHVRKTAKVR